MDGGLREGTRVMEQCVDGTEMSDIVACLDG